MGLYPKYFSLDQNFLLLVSHLCFSTLLPSLHVEVHMHVRNIPRQRWSETKVHYRVVNPTLSCGCIGMTIFQEALRTLFTNHYCHAKNWLMNSRPQEILPSCFRYCVKAQKQL